MDGSLDDQAVGWLLEHSEPAIRYLTARDVLGDRPAYDAAAIADGPLVSGLLARQQPDGGFGDRPYAKWTGAFWRLASLAELAAPGDDPRVAAVANRVLDWLTAPSRRTPHPGRRRGDQALRVDRGAGTRRGLPAPLRRRRSLRAAGPLAGRMAVAGWRLEL